MSLLDRGGNFVLSQFVSTIKPTREYKKTFITQSEFFISSYINKHINDLTEIVKTKDFDSDDFKIIGFKHKTNSFEVGCENFPFEHTDLLFIAFYDDEVEFKKACEFNKIAQYPVGTYSLVADTYGYRLEKINVSNEEPPVLNDDIFTTLNNDINSFFKMKDFYEKNNLAFKRGVLLYGPPGTGKSSSIKYLLNHHKDKYGIIFDCTKSFDKSISTFISNISKNTPVVFVIEDIDGIDDYYRSELLNLLDGINSLTNCFIVATTNHLEALDTAITNRPSRFDRLYHVDNPNAESRRLLIKRFFNGLTESELDRAVKMSEGFSGSYFKEVYILSNIQNCDVFQAIDNIKNQMVIFKENNTKQDYYG